MPQKRLFLPADVAKWTASPAYADLLAFVVALQTSVRGLANDAEIEVSPEIKRILQSLDRVSLVIDHNPIVKDKEVSRFGKPEFRDFYDEVKETAPLLMQQLAPQIPEASQEELAAYFGEAWGNRTRIDYGSGHELNFILFLFCLERAGALSSRDHAALVLKVFCKYMSIMRRLQSQYWLEPAGSHGVWGLDDYHFLPFLFGASQLATHPHMKPKLIHNRELVDTYWTKYMYLECIHFINSIKTVPGKDGTAVSLRWHSPMLDDISAAKSWQKISDGMVKMFQAEVLGKLPIAQHIMFGEYLPAPENLDPHSHEEEDDCGHIHAKDTINTWGDCCGIKVPSAVAASQMNQRVPYD